jgi:hypothetical protein
MTNHKYGEAFERQVRELLAAHGSDKLRKEVYRVAKAGQLSIKSILLLEEIRRVEGLGKSDKG